MFHVLILSANVVKSFLLKLRLRFVFVVSLVFFASLSAPLEDKDFEVTQYNAEHFQKIVNSIIQNADESNLAEEMTKENKEKIKRALVESFKDLVFENVSQRARDNGIEVEEIQNLDKAEVALNALKTMESSANELKDNLALKAVVLDALSETSKVVLGTAKIPENSSSVKLDLTEKWFVDFSQQDPEQKKLPFFSRIKNFFKTIFSFFKPAAKEKILADVDTIKLKTTLPSSFVPKDDVPLSEIRKTQEELTKQVVNSLKEEAGPVFVPPAPLSARRKDSVSVETKPVNINSEDLDEILKGISDVDPNELNPGLTKKPSASSSRIDAFLSRKNSQPQITVSTAVAQNDEDVSKEIQDGPVKPLSGGVSGEGNARNDQKDSEDVQPEKPVGPTVVPAANFLKVEEVVEDKSFTTKDLLQKLLDEISKADSAINDAFKGGGNFDKLSSLFSRLRKSDEPSIKNLMNDLFSVGDADFDPLKIAQTAIGSDSQTKPIDILKLAASLQTLRDMNNLAVAFDQLKAMEKVTSTQESKVDDLKKLVERSLPSFNQLGANSNIMRLHEEEIKSENLSSKVQEYRNSILTGFLSKYGKSKIEQLAVERAGQLLDDVSVKLPDNKNPLDVDFVVAREAEALTKYFSYGDSPTGVLFTAKALAATGNSVNDLDKTKLPILNFAEQSDPILSRVISIQNQSVSDLGASRAASRKADNLANFNKLALQHQIDNFQLSLFHLSVYKAIDSELEGSSKVLDDLSNFTKLKTFVSRLNDLSAEVNKTNLTQTDLERLNQEIKAESKKFGVFARNLNLDPEIDARINVVENAFNFRKSFKEAFGENPFPGDTTKILTLVEKGFFDNQSFGAAKISSAFTKLKLDDSLSVESLKDEIASQEKEIALRAGGILSSTATAAGRKTSVESTKTKLLEQLKPLSEGNDIVRQAITDLVDQLVPKNSSLDLADPGFVEKVHQSSLLKSFVDLDPQEARTILRDVLQDPTSKRPLSDEEYLKTTLNLQLKALVDVTSEKPYWDPRKTDLPNHAKKLIAAIFPGGIDKFVLDASSGGEPFIRTFVEKLSNDKANVHLFRDSLWQNGSYRGNLLKVGDLFVNQEDALPKVLQTLSENTTQAERVLKSVDLRKPSPIDLMKSFLEQQQNEKLDPLGTKLQQITTIQKLIKDVEADPKKLVEVQNKTVELTKDISIASIASRLAVVLTTKPDNIRLKSGESPRYLKDNDPQFKATVKVLKKMIEDELPGDLEEASAKLREIDTTLRTGVGDRSDRSVVAGGTTAYGAVNTVEIGAKTRLVEGEVIKPDGALAKLLKESNPINLITNTKTGMMVLADEVDKLQPGEPLKLIDQNATSAPTASTESQKTPRNDDSNQPVAKPNSSRRPSNVPPLQIPEQSPGVGSDSSATPKVVSPRSSKVIETPSDSPAEPKVVSARRPSQVRETSPRVIPVQPDQKEPINADDLDEIARELEVTSKGVQKMELDEDAILNERVEMENQILKQHEEMLSNMKRNLNEQNDSISRQPSNSSIKSPNTFPRANPEDDSTVSGRSRSGSVSNVEGTSSARLRKDGVSSQIPKSPRLGKS